MTPTANLVRRFAAADLSLCLLLNRGSARPAVRGLFAAASRLGDGVFWYSLMAVWPLLYGEIGVAASLHMLLVGGLGVTIYKAIKRRFVRERPFVTHPAVRLGARPLDRYSFPSGHTLHAVGFSLVVLGYFPWAGWVVVPFAALVAASRVVLGLHYPSDVAMGAAIGASLAVGSFAIVTG